MLANGAEDRMHPKTGSLSSSETQVQAMQSMDWLFKKERIYLLAQFWQQRATLAEKEVSTLKEQLGSNQPLPASTPPNPEESQIKTEAETNEAKLKIDSREVKMEQAKMELARPASASSRGSPVVNQGGSLENELATKEKEISQLVEDVQRLRASLTALQEAHAQQLQRLEERLDEKKQHIARLEARLDGQRDYDEIKREISILRSIELGQSVENKPMILPPIENRPARESPERRDHGEESPWSPATPPPPLNNNTTNHNNNPPRSPFRYEEGRFRFAEDPGPLPPGALVGRLGDSLIPKGDPMEARLQEMLRYNMDKYAAQNLDTLHISRRVRELLSVHNIGQRLFAKYVLGLSQGTVSELLSKPKPWDKLTEKGRDSYRKMHAWACDENAVMLLKSLIPKKVGKDGVMSGMTRPDGSEIPEDRLAHILNEASHLMKNPGNNEDSRSNDDSGSPRTQCPSPFSNKDSNQNRKFMKKFDNDDIPQEKVVRIYQEELAKIMSRRVEDIRQQQREGFPGPGALPPHMERPPEEIRMALEAYHRELAKLGPGAGMHGVPGIPSFPGLLALQAQQHALQAQHQQQHQQQQQHPHINGGGGVQDLSIKKESPQKPNGLTEDRDRHQEGESESPATGNSAFSLVRPKPEPGIARSGSSASSPLGNSILPPVMTDDFGGSAAASPLQRMASITNSLISQPSNQQHHTPSQRPMKAVLPPITQQQFDLFNNLNTEDIVRRVKEALSQYSISQRLFGESVLGLSQGSVSDLLARPKPWHMLTQKGREPFIRMKMFLEDDNAVHKLVASQYKIAPEKLMRTGNYGGSAPCTPISKSQMPMQNHHPTPKMISEATSLLSKMQAEHAAMMPGAMHIPGAPPMLYPPHLHLPPPGEKERRPSQVPHSPLPPHHRALHQHISPSVYEMAALTQDLDTQVITTKIKEALLANNIGQKIFGEAVLGLSQGSVSELLSKPKPWHMLSIKGREPFIRMQLWLNDAHNIDRLQALKNERREANKRRRSSGPGAQDNSSDTSSNDTAEFYHSSSPGPASGGPPSAKKQRVLFSEEQKEALRLAFALDPYPNVPAIEFLAAELGLSTRTITNWFHNHRMRLKQQTPHGGNDQRDQNPGSGQTQFDPVRFRLLLQRRLLELQKERAGLGAGLPGVPLPYPPYFAADPNLAALLGRRLLPSADFDTPAERTGAETPAGLDLSLPLKRDPDADDFDEDDVESEVGSEASLDDAQRDTDSKPEEPKAPLGGARSSRRKPAAPQWVNPSWQDENPRHPDEVIINGVCVMRGAEYARRDTPTAQVSPSPPPQPSVTPPVDPPAAVVNSPPPSAEVKTERDEERWDY